jgi:RNA polymerase sigma-70 factor (ECF subfamily)
MEESLRDRAIDLAYREHATEVYRVAFGVLRDRDEALDATHDAFARAWERWDQYDSQRPLRAWLHGIVVNVALDQLRRRRVRALAIPVLGRSIAEIGRHATMDPAADVARRQFVDEAMATLDPRSRATLVLRHYYGYDYAQIGSFLGLGSGTVGSILSRAHAALRRRLGPDDRSPSAPAARPWPSGPAGSGSRARGPDHATEPPEVLP